MWPASAAKRRVGRGWPEPGAARCTIWRWEEPPESQLDGDCADLLSTWPRDLLDEIVDLTALRTACEQPEVLRDHAARRLDALGCRRRLRGRLLLQPVVRALDRRPAL